MMRANTKAAIKQADIIINVPLAEYGSLDWRRSDELIAEGYKAAEAMRDTLLPLAVSEAEYAAWKADRQARRRTALPIPAFVSRRGLQPPATRAASASIARPSRRVSRSTSIAIETDLDALSGLDRYETITWRFVGNPAGRDRSAGRGAAQVVRPAVPDDGAQPGEHDVRRLQAHADGAVSRRTTWSDRGSELRVDAHDRIGSERGAELYKPIGSSPLFVAPYAGVGNRTFNLIQDDAIVASYGQTLSEVGLNVGDQSRTG